ncbi:SpoIIE family protein phosphatase [Blastococcus tunisiensis]|uniref:SpoIIE family protein phosphatase n=1 Tax=Blastococcus tunisiensis TaxID=1798228 RepID=UPI0021109E29|nr:SpoIIE family protein phosphatase [Blastococcus sp. DSM 46838]
MSQCPARGVVGCLHVSVAGGNTRSRRRRIDGGSPRGLASRWSQLGRVAVLDTRPEILLGAESRNRRTDHEARLQSGESLLFYTDGLVEDGRSLIDEGIARLVRVATEVVHVTVDELCDQLLERIVRHRPTTTSRSWRCDATPTPLKTSACACRRYFIAGRRV